MAIETIIDFYTHQSILITGATGFIGKLLVEKLLWSCPELNKIYVIVRSRKNMSPIERWDEVTKSVAFDRLKSKRPGILERKIHVINGDIGEKRLGLSDKDYKLLQDNVNIILHSAATVRFNDPLHIATFINLRGTYEVVKLALGIKNLKVMVHVSTAFCNPLPHEIDEKLYPIETDWKKIIEISEQLDKRDIAILFQKFHNFPNTYTFTKHLTEHLVSEYRTKIPISIVRPSIVVSSISEPMPGWIDTIFGPSGFMILGGKGILRVLYSDSNALLDYIPADVVVKSILVVAWRRIQCSVGDLPIYHAATLGISLTVHDFNESALHVLNKYPMESIVWYPCVTYSSNYLCYKIQAIFKQFFPSVIVDSVLRMIGRKEMLVRIQIQVQNAMLAVSYFQKRSWYFSNENLINLLNDILPEDKDDFDFDTRNENTYKLFENGIRVGKKLLINDDTTPKAIKNYKRMYWVDKGLKLTFGAIIMGGLFVYFGL